MDGNDKPSAPPPSTVPRAVSARFQEVLAKLRIEFEQQLPAKMELARELMQRCTAKPQDEEAITELHRLLHTLAGSAGTFGRAPLGAKAKEIELMLDELKLQPARTAPDFDKARHELEELAQLAAG